jgi:CubicO group peptidase (beta-lactamase class C family)
LWIVLATLVQASTSSSLQRTLAGMDERLNALREELDLPSLAVAVVKDGKIIFERGYGWASKEDKVPATAQTPYAIGSITKVLTATALMRLVEEGKIDLDRPANDYLGGHKLRSFQGDPEATTVRRLGNHSGGLRHYAHWIYEDEPRRVLPIGELIDRYGVVMYQPGQGWYYANLGFGAIQLAIEQVSGDSYCKYLTGNVFEPLGMTRTSIGPIPALAGETAVRYSEDTGLRAPPYQSEPFAAGEGYSTAHDLASFALFVLKEKIDGGQPPISKESIDKMLRPTYWREGLEGNGVAWWSLFESVQKVGDRVVTGRPVYYEHGGSGYGMKSRLMLFPQENLGFVFLTNTDSNEARQAVTDIVLETFSPKVKEKIPQLTNAPWAEWQRASQRPPGSSVEEPIATFTGEWAGEIVAPEGSTPLTLKFFESGEIFGSLDGYPMAQLANIHKDDRDLVGLFRGYPLDVDSDWRRQPIWVQVRLERKGDQLIGAVHAISATDAGYEEHYTIALPAVLYRPEEEKEEEEKDE